jgi:uncharacterized damage-inducible protein DinB
MLRWRETVLQRLNGLNILFPENNFFKAITNNSESEWKNLQKRLDDSQSAILHYISSGPVDLYKTPADGGFTRYELLQGILQHDAYHLGQIILIKKILING